VLAGQSASATAAADMAADAVAAWGQALVPAVAAAKIRCGEAAGTGAAIAHQVHGAIGFTREHRLHHYTRRLWAWRDEYGREAEWARRLGSHLVAAGPSGLWPAITAI
jgi:alkylation response protein AidB-like acyl-CoA dehydrogenase